MALLALGCIELAGSAARAENTAPPALTAAQVQSHYAAVAEASYADALDGARALQRAIKAFLADPSPATHEAAKKAWIAARDRYCLTEAYRFYGGPIDAEDGPEPRINAWPLDEAYIDYVEGKPDAGLINDPRVTIDRAHLVEANEKGGEVNISTGWHAIEFLLWGQDLDPSGPGKRPFTDFVDGKGKNASRRRQYLAVVTDLLVDDLAQVANAWKPGAENYRARFVRDGEGVKKILTGLGVLTRGELAGERMEVAMDSQDQEDEHSCFSDNTHRDIVGDLRGIGVVWGGKYERPGGVRLDGPGLGALVATKDAKVARQFDEDWKRAIAAAEKIQPPFDREIIGGREAPGRKRVQETIDAIKALARDLASAADALGIKQLATRVRKGR